MPDLTPDVLTLVETRRAAAPHAVAVADDASRRTAAQLDAEATGWAAALAARGVAGEDVVAVVAQRSPVLLAMMLGVLRAGGAYLPIEAGTPADRARRMCTDAGVGVLAAQAGHEAYATALAQECGAVVVTADEAAPPPAAGRGVPVRSPESLAYVIFTSGSTGTPKGAMVTHGGLANHVAAKTHDLALGPGDVIGFTAPLSFDISVWQALTALTVGARVAVASAENLAEPAELLAWVARHGVTVLEIVPSHLSLVLDALEDDERRRAEVASLRLLVATGEALPGPLARRWFACCPGVALVNAYGPTECSDDVTHHVVTAAEAATRAWPSIGREILHTRVHVVDADGQEVAPGGEGELLVGGRGVGRGYVADPARTALAFVPDHLSGEPGGRLYRTGDRGRRAADGTLDYLGRRDRQVKVRGYRIELGDVEAQLLRLPPVAAAACVLTGDALHAFVTLRPVPAGEPAARPAEILDRLRDLVPGWLVPQRLTVLDRMPTGTSGKIDHAALQARREPPPGSPAVTADLRLDSVCAIVAEVLGRPGIGPDEHFFAAGGDSLGAMRLIALARKRFAAENAPLRGFLAEPTPRGLLAVLEAARSAPRPAPADLLPGALSSGQERLWFVEQLNRHRDPLLIHLELTLRGRLDRRGLQHALDAVVRRHQPLRTVFSQQRGAPVATVWPAAEVRLDAPEDVRLSARTTQPPLMTAGLQTLAPDRHVLTLKLHHLVADGWSLAVLGQEIGTWYQRWIDGDVDVPLPEVTFGHYIGEERRWLDGPEAAECESYWIEQLAGAPYALELPTDRPRPAKPDHTTASVVRELCEQETAAVAALARAAHATPFMAVMTAFSVVLRELTGSDDLVLGIDAVNRSWPGSEQLVGTFVNQLPVRLRSSGAGSTFTALLEQVRRQCLGAYAHERLPFHKIVAAVNPPRRAGRFPLFQVKVTHQSAWRSPVSLPDIEVLPREIPDAVMDADLMLDMSGESGRLRLELLYLPALQDRPTATAWAEAVADVLRSAVTVTAR